MMNNKLKSFDWLIFTTEFCNPFRVFACYCLLLTDHLCNLFKMVTPTMKVNNMYKYILISTASQD